MKALLTAAFILVGGSIATAAPPAGPQLPKELWEKKVETELAVLRFEAEATEKLLRGSKDELLLWGQRIEKGDRPANAKPIRDALAAWEREGLDQQAKKLVELFAGVKGARADLDWITAEAGGLRGSLQRVVAALTADPRLEVLREKVQKLEQGGDAKELARARRELFHAAAPSIRARAQRALALQLQVNEGTSILAGIAAHSPEEAKARNYNRHASELAVAQFDVESQILALAALFKEHREEALGKALMDALEAAKGVKKPLLEGKADDACLKAQADVAATLARTVALLPADKPVFANPDLSAEHRDVMRKLIAALESLEERAARQADSLQRLRAESHRRLLADLENDPAEPKKP